MGQNYKNHPRFVIGYHMILSVLLLAGLIGSIINLCGSWDSNILYSASLLVMLFICCIFMYWYVRVFPLKAQDRAIRSEENFRHYILTGKQLPADLRMEQIIALRFAPDEEFSELTQRALRENLSAKAIMQTIRNWKGDYCRV